MIFRFSDNHGWGPRLNDANVRVKNFSPPQDLPIGQPRGVAPTVIAVGGWGKYEI